MTILSNEELKLVIGGSLTGTMINAFVRGINSMLELGRSLGTAIRRVIDGKACPL